MISYFQGQASARINRDLDKGLYAQSDLVEVSIAYPLPYAPSHTVTERFNGEIEVGGIIYNYVSLRLSNDTLHLLCIPNTEKTKLSASGHEFTRQMAQSENSPVGKKGGAPIAVQKGNSSDYSCANTEILIVALDPLTLLHLSSFSENPVSGHFSAIIQPPKA